MKYLKDFSELIIENKTEALRKTYVAIISDKFDIDLQKANKTFDYLSQVNDPTLNKVYIQWILNNSINNFDNFKKLNNFIKEDLYKWKEYLNIYHKVKDKLPIESKNIQRLSIKDLTDIALQYKEKEQEIGTKNEVLDKKYKINENNDYLVYMFKTSSEEDFQFYQLVSTNTEWCTRPNYYTFKDYINKSPLFVFINKNNRSQKYQFHEQTSQFMDKNDNEINDKLLSYFFKLINKYLPEDFLMRVKIDNSYGYINKQGNIIAKGFKYAYSFSEGFAKVQFQDNSYGFINKQGEVIAKGFKDVYSFSEGFAGVQFQDNSYGFINKQGNIIAKGFYYVWQFSEGFAKVQLQNNSWGYINNKGNITSKGFKGAWSFSKGFAGVRFQDDSLGYINNKGNIYEEDKRTLISKNDKRLKGVEIYPEKFI